MFGDRYARPRELGVSQFFGVVAFFTFLGQYKFKCRTLGIQSGRKVNTEEKREKRRKERDVTVLIVNTVFT